MTDEKWLDDLIDEHLARREYWIFGDPWFESEYRRAFTDEKSRPWFYALNEIYESNDPISLTVLIKAGQRPTPEMQPHIDALFRTKKLVPINIQHPPVPRLWIDREALGKELWFRVLKRFYKAKGSWALRTLIKAGVAPSEAMKPHIDQFFQLNTFVQNGRGQKGEPSIWALSLTEAKLRYELEQAKAEANTQEISLEEFLGKRLNEEIPGEERMRIEKMLNLHVGKRGSARKRRK